MNVRLDDNFEDEEIIKTLRNHDPGTEYLVVMYTETEQGIRTHTFFQSASEGYRLAEVLINQALRDEGLALQIAQKMIQVGMIANHKIDEEFRRRAKNN